jgi:uncharacterized membrane protein HdeD (DUF308 family)
MKPFKNFFRSERFEMDWRPLVAQGVVIMLIGIALVLVCTVRPNVIILSARDLSWLPASGMVILALGLVECLDAFLAEETRDFLQNLQVGVLDTVIGALIILSVAEEPARFSMMIANYLIVRGVVRVTLIYALQMPRAALSSIGGFLSVIMGFMIWMGWPSTAGWFLSLCLNVEIAVRGWAIIIFALWIKNQTDTELLRAR